MSAVLWLSNETPDPEGQGGQRRQYHQIRQLARSGHAVTLCALQGPQDDNHVSHLATVVRTRTHLTRRVRNPQHIRLLKGLSSSKWDLIVLAHTESWGTFEPLLQRSTAHLWVDLHNVLGMNADGRRTRWWDVEERVLRRATVVSVCSDAEQNRLRDQHGDADAEVVVMPHGVDPQEWTARRDPADQPVVKAFGNWGWGPNSRGLAWFLNDVWPVVDVPEARFEVAGADAHIQIEGLQGVSFVGRVPRLDAWLSDAWVVVVPVVEGVGAPVKYLEALASRSPVLATVDGAPYASERAALVSDQAQRWTLKLHELLSGPPPAETDVSATDLDWSRSTRLLLDWLDYA